MEKRESYLHELSRIRGEINRLFETALSSAGLDSGSPLPPGAWLPPMDVLEEDDHYEFHVELPGVDPGGIHCSIDDGVLQISGQRSMPLEEGSSFRRMERIYGPFRRMVELRGPVASEPQVDFRDGILTVRVDRK